VQNWEGTLAIDWWVRLPANVELLMLKRLLVYFCHACNRKWNTNISQQTPKLKMCLQIAQDWPSRLIQP